MTPLQRFVTERPQRVSLPLRRAIGQACGMGSIPQTTSRWLVRAGQQLGRNPLGHGGPAAGSQLRRIDDQPLEATQLDLAPLEQQPRPRTVGVDGQRDPAVPRRTGRFDGSRRRSGRLAGATAYSVAQRDPTALPVATSRHTPENRTYVPIQIAMPDLELPDLSGPRVRVRAPSPAAYAWPDGYPEQ